MQHFAWISLKLDELSTGTRELVARSLDAPPGQATSDPMRSRDTFGTAGAFGGGPVDKKNLM
jgi:hypothetical protein